MALSDPLSVTIDSGTFSLPRVMDDLEQATYVAADQTLSEIVSSRLLKASRIRSTIRLDRSLVAADPITALNRTLSGSVYVVCDFPTWGFTEAQKVGMFTGLSGQLSASTNAMLKKVLNREH